MFLIYPHGQYVWSDAEFGQCIANVTHGGPTEISDILGKLWGYLTQKYLSKLVKYLNSKNKCSFWSYLGFNYLVRTQFLGIFWFIGVGPEWTGGLMVCLFCSMPKLGDLQSQFWPFWPDHTKFGVICYNTDWGVCVSHHWVCLCHFAIMPGVCHHSRTVY